MEQKQKIVQPSQQYRFLPYAGAFITLIIIMLLWAFFVGTERHLTGIQSAVLFFAPILTGWFIGWGLRFRFESQNTTSTGMSVALIEFILSLLPIIFFLIIITGIYASAQAVSDYLRAEGVENMDAYITYMLCIIPIILTIGLAIYQQLAKWLRVRSGLARDF